MSNSNIDNESATETFVSAYEASQEPTPRAPRRVVGIETTAEFFARERLQDATEQDSERAIVDDLDANASELREIATRPASHLDPTPVHDDLFKDEYTLMAERHGADSDVAMSDLIEFGGTVDSSKLFKKSTLSESEKALVSQYANNPDCDVPVNPMKASYTRPETLSQIKRRLHRQRFFYRVYPEQLAVAAVEELEYLQRTFRSKLTYVPVKPALKPVDQDERREARDLNREFKRSRAIQEYENLYPNEYSYNLDRNLRSQCPDSIRYQSWSEQLPWCGEEYFEQTFFGYTDSELEEAMSIEAEFYAEDNDTEEFERFSKELDYQDEARERQYEEAEQRCNHRNNFIRDYNRRARQDEEFLEAMSDYNLEIALEDDLARLEEEEQINDIMSFGRYREYDKVG